MSKQKTTLKIQARSVYQALRERHLLYLLDQCAMRYGVTTDELLSRSQTAALSRARRNLYLLTRQAGGYSYPELAQIFGRRHTSIRKQVLKAESEQSAS